MGLKRSKGFTLVELLLAVLILSGAVGGALLLYTASMASSQLAWDTTVATTHAEHILEEMQARDSLQAILALNWQGWIEGQGLNTLPGEKIDIVFADPGGDPLDVEVTVRWTGKLRAHRVTLETKITK